MHRGWLLGVLVVIFAPSVFAAQISKVKGRAVLISLDGESVIIGDQFYVINASGKRNAIVVIKKIVKKDQAIGSITAGKDVLPGETLKRRDGAPIKQASQDKSSGPTKLQKAYWGLLAGYNMNNMNVDLSTGSTVSLSGSAFSAKVMFDYMLFRHVWFRGSSGYQGFSVTGPSSCAGAACTADITYLAFDFVGRYVFTEGDFRPWLGGGFSMLFPATKSSSALDTASITNASVFLFMGGMDFQVSPKMYVPVSVEYALFPKSSTTDASWYSLRLGLAWAF